MGESVAGQEPPMARQNGKSGPPALRKIVQMKHGYPIVGVIPDLVRDPLGLLQRVAREHPGEIVTREELQQKL